MYVHTQYRLAWISRTSTPQSRAEMWSATNPLEVTRILGW